MSRIRLPKILVYDKLVGLNKKVHQKTGLVLFLQTEPLPVVALAEAKNSIQLDELIAALYCVYHDY